MAVILKFPSKEERTRAAGERRFRSTRGQTSTRMQAQRRPVIRPMARLSGALIGCPDSKRNLPVANSGRSIKHAPSSAKDDRQPTAALARVIELLETEI